MRRKHYKLKPTAYIVLGVLVLIIILCVYAIARAVFGGSDKPAETAVPVASPTTSPEIIRETMTPVPAATNTPVPTPEPLAATPVPAPPTPTAKPKATPRSATSSERKNAKNGTLTADGVNLRNGPGTDYERIGNYPKGSTMKVYATDGEFLFVKMDKDDKVGFIAKKYVQVGEGAAAATPTPNVPSDAVSGKVSASKVAIRKGPSSSDGAVTEAKRGDVLYIYYQVGDYYYVETTSGRKGFCVKKYVTVSNKATIPTK